MAIISGGGGTEPGVAVRVYQNPGAPVAQANDVQTVTLTGATGGTFALTFGGQTTTPLAWNAATATVQAALAALSTVKAGNVAVSGAAGGPYTVGFQGALANAPQPVMTANATLLTGTTPTAVVAHTTTGAVGTLAGIVPRGGLLVDTTNAILYINSGTQNAPTWSQIAHA